MSRTFKVQRKIIRKVRRKYSDLFVKQIPIDKLLMGGEGGRSAATYARLTGDFLRPSTPLSESPHVKFLRRYQEIGCSILDQKNLQNTEYFKNAVECIGVFGQYFDCKDTDQIQQHAKSFIALFESDAATRPKLHRHGQSVFGAPVLVRPIANSGGRFEIADGHHRLSVAFVKGQTSYPCKIYSKDPVVTPLQQGLLDCVWIGGRQELYQPIDSPEIKDEWVLVRKCADRFAMMKDWLAGNGFADPSNLTYLDIGSSYGWFVSEMSKLGFKAYGVERDPAAVSLGLSAYGLTEEQIERGDIVNVLGSLDRKYDITSCLSVLHHFAMGSGSVSAQEFIKLVDRATGRALFLDTGQSHEQWFKDKLSEWTVDYIQAWLKDNTTFREITPLGVDQDNKSPFRDNYRRTLFVCSR